ncbi:MAG: hypothetical protein DI628_00320 [Blastochloris viridis]|uniref:YchJ-like middle NTF2-like domain-containing protein n=1 Tax=Blastochloris viridis TaxID=1079 RepID=A0A6N4R6E3_BLAVI|nr:MAG: hypothetical protein DI628_00320 [Blastochloris viridis]
MSPCPCGSQKEFDACCGPILGGKDAPTAEALMRSRYTAFTKGDFDYLEKTNSKRIAHEFNRVDLEISAPDTEWLGLDIRETTAGGEDDKTGTVKFAVTYKFKGRTFTQIEDAKFIRQDSKWVYDKGDIELEKKQPHHVVKIGRNDPCPCGSGQKYKKCCGK